MTSPKSQTPDVADDPVVEEDAADVDATPVEAAEEVEEEKPRPQPSSAKKSPGTKEVIAFKWKLVGESYGVALTLFKAIERPDVEAQLTRVDREGYYKNLRILEADEKVKQPSGRDVRAMALAGAKTELKVEKKPRRAAKRKASASARPTTTRLTPKKVKVAKTAKASKPAKPAKPAKAAKKAKAVKAAKASKSAKKPKVGKKPKATKAAKPKKAAKAKAAKRSKKATSKKSTSAKSTKKRSTKKKK